MSCISCIKKRLSLVLRKGGNQEAINGIMDEIRLTLMQKASKLKNEIKKEEFYDKIENMEMSDIDELQNQIKKERQNERRIIRNSIK